MIYLLILKNIDSADSLGHLIVWETWVDCSNNNNKSMRHVS